MEYVLMTLAGVWIILFFKGLVRFAICGFNVKLFMSDSTYAWIGVLFLANLLLFLIAGVVQVIGMMVQATL